MYVAIAVKKPDELREGVGYVEHLQFTPGARAVVGRIWRLRPAEDGVYIHVLRNFRRQRHVLGSMTVVFVVRLIWLAAANVTNTAAITTREDQQQEGARR